MHAIDAPRYEIDELIGGTVEFARVSPREKLSVCLD
jgi:hypothetical protein